MKPVPYTPYVPSPRVLVPPLEAPEVLARATVRGLCATAGIPCRVTSPHTPEVLLHSGADHFVGPGVAWVGVGGQWEPSPLAAIRVLEVLAHGFHDYAARESICRRGLFVAPARKGRPPRWGRPATPSERMRRHRARTASTHDTGVTVSASDDGGAK